ncbi:amino acid ABC transporter substrate-binding protein [Burkholderia pyrrocinia]|uniref:amino acid ABC transporter substrate-binding protein n=1 Tax=Burkholderia pyrrocinia TaxID=60550 RepID=UPI00215A643D|nr:amino acid ABC transporter substrate-binding protein [Burkholderia pyrrocinia]UVE69342.1 amino acid ABC transporter substrate-binding protein [Burkholderia pyrrocinia]
MPLTLQWDTSEGKGQKILRFWTALVVARLFAACAAANAQEAADLSSAGSPEGFTPVTLSGTLEKVRDSGTITLGYRDSLVPFSFLNARNEPIGYSIELCKALVSAIEDSINMSVSIRWGPVTADNRIDQVVNGQVDLECGSTTRSLERQKRVALSPIIYVSGTKVMMKAGALIRSFRDLAGKKVAVTAGTTNEIALRDLDQKFNLGMQLLVVREHKEGFEAVASGKVDAFATDEALLYGLIAQNAGRRGQFQVVGDYLSYEPYEIMFRRDDPLLAQVVKTTFEELAADGEFERQYKRWFIRKLPSGTSLNLPMSTRLKIIIQTMAAKAA